MCGVCVCKVCVVCVCVRCVCTRVIGFSSLGVRLAAAGSRAGSDCRRCKSGELGGGGGGGGARGNGRGQGKPFDKGVNFEEF